MALRKKLWRTMLKKKAQYGAALLLVIISSMIFYSFTAAGANLIDNLNQFFEQNNVEGAQFTVSEPIQEVQSLEEAHEVTIEERYSKDVAVDDNTTLRLLNATDSINQYSVIEGEALEQDDELLIDPNFAKENDVAIGDTYPLAGETFTVVGTMAVPDYVYPLKSESGFLKNSQAFGVAVVKSTVFEQWTDAQLFYNITGIEGDKAAIKRDITQSNRILKWVDREDNNRISFIRGDIQGIKQAGETLPIGMLLITVTIIMILLWRLLKTEYAQIGTLYAIGYKKSEIIRHYVSYSAIIAILGSVLGTIFGWFLMQPLLSMFAAFYNLPVLTINPHFLYLVISLLLPVLFFVPLTYVLARRVLKIPPVVLIKGGGVQTKLNFLERSINLKRFRFTSRFKLREVLRNLPRVTFLTIGVMFATVLLLIGFVTNDSFDYLIQQNFKNVNQYNYHYTFNQLQTEIPLAGQKAASAPFVIKNKDNQSIQITALKPDNTTIHLENRAGERLDFNTTIINRSLADKLNIEKGDALTVENQLNNKTFTIKVDQIANSYLGDRVYMPLSEFNQQNDYPKRSYTSLYSKESLKIDPEALLTTTTTESTIDGYNQLIKPLQYMVIGIAIGAGIIGILIIYILVSLLIEENSYKISLMKVIGYDDKSIRRLMIDFNSWFVILGFLIGIPVTLWSMSAFLTSITTEMNLTIPVQLDWLNVVISFIVILVAYFISILLNQRKLNNVSMHEAINRSTE
ncbi:permease [Paraliobacillus quinghaiensis]|uniref:Permease n=1 Tax=Paraliobacillus quinghaiensis TaxID=470815 RepID=A0A917TUH3_9BACI|nr:ABC transporter permease [Paraliobacillus quinghaiensis]GGM38157.1 permease [Paraliobacillus quinghaiensis]